MAGSVALQPGDIVQHTDGRYEFVERYVQCFEIGKKQFRKTRYVFVNLANGFDEIYSSQEMRDKFWATGEARKKRKPLAQILVCD